MINNRHVSLIVFCLSILLIVSCSDTEKGSNGVSEVQNYKLEIFDSLQFDILSSRLTVADVDPETGDMLVLQPNPPKIWLMDKNLNPLAELERPKDDPEGPGEHALSATFFDDGIATLGWFKVAIYDREFNFRRSMIPNYPSVGLIMSGYKNIFDFTSNDGVPQLVTYYGQPQTNRAPVYEEYYDDFNIVDVVNPAESKYSRDSVFRPFGKLTEDSRYKSGKSFSFLMPKFDVKGDKFYYAMNSDTTLYTRSLPDGEITNSYTIPFDKFILSEGSEMGSFGNSGSSQPRDTPGVIESVFHHNDLEVLIYTSGLKISEKAVFDRSSPEYRQQVERANPKKYLIVKNGKRVNTQAQLDKRVYFLEFMDDNGVIYAMQNSSVLEEEPEKYTIYKLRIVADE